MSTPERLNHPMIHLNLPVTDVAVAAEFYRALGWPRLADYSDETTVAFQVSDAIVVLLLQRDVFDSFHDRETAQVGSPREVIACLTVDTPAGVDEMLRRVRGAGGRISQEAAGEEGVYGAAFEDPDGHAWELMTWAEQD